MNENLSNVSIIFPVRSRAKILPHFLKCILSLNYPKSKISIHCCINDSTDDSDIILYQFQKQYQNEYNKIQIYTYNLNTPKYESNHNGNRGGTEIVRQPLGRGLYKEKGKLTNLQVYKNLAKIRNGLLIKTTGEFVASIDTDIMFPEHTLKTLINNIQNSKYSMVSALISNGYIYSPKINELKGLNTSPYEYMNIMKRTETGYEPIPIEEYEGKDLLNVDLTGAISVFKRELIDNGVRYGDYIPGCGEDSNFCHSAIEKGYSIACNCQLRATHVMSSEYLDLYLKGNFIW